MCIHMHAENISDPGRWPNCKPAYSMCSRSTLNIHIDRESNGPVMLPRLFPLFKRYGAVTALAQQNGWPTLFLYCYLMRRKTLAWKIPSSLRFSGCKSWCRDFNLFFFSLLASQAENFSNYISSRWTQTPGWDEYENFLTLTDARPINKKIYIK